MIVKTLFRHESKYEVGEVELRLLPGIPHLQIVGLPDASMRECGIKIKSALRARGLKWPRGHQVVVNLRPSHLRKQSAGVELAIVLAFLAQTEQLAPTVQARLGEGIVYGEVGLDGELRVPYDMGTAVRLVRPHVLITGTGADSVLEGRWLEWPSLNDSECRLVEKQFDWSARWTAPSLPDFRISEDAAAVLAVTAHAGLNVLVAGPQGSGKTTWAKMVHALSARPEVDRIYERVDLFGSSEADLRWRPLEQPHHSITPQAMVGGGSPIRPGVISRAHGGVLIMDEFLEFHPQVLEALREPVEGGWVEIARKAPRHRLRANFQLIGTTNLCLCGRLCPGFKKPSCGHALSRCRSVCARLSGPVLDRFDLLVFSGTWLGRKAWQVPLAEVAQRLERAREFARSRSDLLLDKPPPTMTWLELSHRRRRSLLRVARALADLEECGRPRPIHFERAYSLVVSPMEHLGQLFA